MSPTPHSIGRDQTLARAGQVMRQHHIRHLPVLHGGRLVGVLSERDVMLVEALSSADPEDIYIEEAMTDQVYTVHSLDPLSEVAATMARHRYGCAVVMEANRVVGVFTTVDACRALARTLDAPFD